MNEYNDILNRITNNNRMCICPICGHTKESTCEWITANAKAKKLKPCYCCVDRETGKAIGNDLFKLI